MNVPLPLIVPWNHWNVKPLPPLVVSVRRNPPLLCASAEGIGAVTVGQDTVTVTVALFVLLLQSFVTCTQYVVVVDGLTTNGLPEPMNVPLPGLGPWNQRNVKLFPPDAVALRENPPPWGVDVGWLTVTVGQGFTVTVAVALFAAGVQGPLTWTQ